MTGNWDGIFDGNNFWLYLPPDGSPAKFWRQDLDLSFGLNSGFIPVLNSTADWATRDIYNWTGILFGKYYYGNPITPMIKETPSWKAIFVNYAKLILGYFEQISAQFTEDQAFIAPLMINDKVSGKKREERKKCFQFFLVA